MLLRSSLLLLLVCQIILPSITVRGQESVAEPTSDQVRFGITVESSSWSRRTPSYVMIQIENVSDKDIAFKTRYSFHLKRKDEAAAARDHGRLGDSYWSPAGMVNDGEQLVVVPHGSTPFKPGETSRTLPNDIIRLRKGELKLIKVDLSRFPWNDRILSGWPSGENFSHVPKGTYLLEFAIYTNKNDLLSNEVEVSLD